jgi:hypothetical protein
MDARSFYRKRSKKEIHKVRRMSSCKMQLSKDEPHPEI